ncbi:hypothetical protein MN608_11050 [Microdochium nivale]|nr:hypothetical protein MN608_11050 [Microdochium nivale]
MEDDTCTTTGLHRNWWRATGPYLGARSDDKTNVVLLLLVHVHISCLSTSCSRAKPAVLSLVLSIAARVADWSLMRDCCSRRVAHGVLASGESPLHLGTLLFRGNEAEEVALAVLCPGVKVLVAEYVPSMGLHER